jgi:hypothetical protein
MMNSLETFLKDTEESIFDRYESKNITIEELIFHYPDLNWAIKDIFMENDPPKRIYDDTVIPFSREKCHYLSSVIKSMLELKYKGANMIRAKDVADDLYKNDFPWNDYKDIAGLNDLKKFIQWFKDNFNKLAIDEP